MKPILVASAIGPQILRGDRCMTGLKVMGVCWVMAIVATPVVGSIVPTDAGQKLMTGSAQVVLAVVVLGLSAAIIWTVKRLLKSFTERVEEAKSNAQAQVAQANTYTTEITQALSDNSTALSDNATASMQLKEAVYKLGEVVDRKLDRV